MIKLLYNKIDLTRVPSPAFAMCNYIGGVEFGTYKNGVFSWGDKHSADDLLELHVFDEKKEFRAVLSDGEFITSEIGRENEPQYHLDEYMRFFGEEYKNEEPKRENITVLTDRGHSKEFYIKIGEDKFKNGISLGVRNYIEYDENDMIRVVNYRLLGLFSGKSNEKREIVNYV